MPDYDRATLLASLQLGHAIDYDSEFDSESFELPDGEKLQQRRNELAARYENFFWYPGNTALLQPEIITVATESYSWLQDPADFEIELINSCLAGESDTPHPGSRWRW